MPVGKAYLPVRGRDRFSNDDPQLGQAIKNALAALIADGTYRQLLRK
ncbi:hypothetical protein ACE10Z_34885 [Bradyrhizobium sp. Pha-3]